MASCLIHATPDCCEIIHSDNGSLAGDQTLPVSKQRRLLRIELALCIGDGEDAPDIIVYNKTGSARRGTRFSAHIAIQSHFSRGSAARSSPVALAYGQITPATLVR